MSKQVRMEELENMTLKQLYELARKYKISYYSKLTKKELIVSIIKEESAEISERPNPDADENHCNCAT